MGQTLCRIRLEDHRSESGQGQGRQGRQERGRFGAASELQDRSPPVPVSRTGHPSSLGGPGSCIAYAAHLFHRRGTLRGSALQGKKLDRQGRLEQEAKRRGTSEATRV